MASMDKSVSVKNTFINLDPPDTLGRSRSRRKSEPMAFKPLEGALTDSSTSFSSTPQESESELTYDSDNDVAAAPAQFFHSRSSSFDEGDATNFAPLMMPIAFVSCPLTTHAWRTPLNPAAQRYLPDMVIEDMLEQLKLDEENSAQSRMEEEDSTPSHMEEEDHTNSQTDEEVGHAFPAEEHQVAGGLATDTESDGDWTDFLECPDLRHDSCSTCDDVQSPRRSCEQASLGTKACTEMKVDTVETVEESAEAEVPEVPSDEVASDVEKEEFGQEVEVPDDAIVSNIEPDHSHRSMEQAHSANSIPERLDTPHATKQKAEAMPFPDGSSLLSSRRAAAKVRQLPTKSPKHQAKAKSKIKHARKEQTQDEEFDVDIHDSKPCKHNRVRLTIGGTILSLFAALLLLDFALDYEGGWLRRLVKSNADADTSNADADTSKSDTLGQVRGELKPRSNSCTCQDEYAWKDGHGEGCWVYRVFIANGVTSRREACSPDDIIGNDGIQNHCKRTCRACTCAGDDPNDWDVYHQPTRESLLALDRLARLHPESMDVNVDPELTQLARKVAQNAGYTR